MNERLKKIYSSDEFSKYGYQVIDLLSEFLSNSSSGNHKVMNWNEPSEQLEFWEGFTQRNDDPISFIKNLIERSIHLHNPKYMGHQLNPTAPLSALIGVVGELMNNGMAIYEMGPAGTAIEKLVIKMICEEIGYDQNSDGYITSGGTLGNLTALLTARQNSGNTDIWSEGVSANMGIMVSEEAHYSVDRAIRIMGFGDTGIIKVPVNDDYTINTSLLEKYYNDAQQNGINVISIVGCAPSTSTGKYDDIDAIADFALEKGIWFHLDAAHGGAASFSDKYKYLMNGANRADSIVIDGHKMMMTPTLLTFVLYKNKQDSYSTFAQKAQYLWEKNHDEEWYNIARRTMECTKLSLSIRFYILYYAYGKEIFDDYVTYVFTLGRDFAKLLKTNSDFELATEPHSNIVCFRYLKEGFDNEGLNKLNSDIRNRLLRDGNFYIVQTTINELVFLRTTLTNPLTEINHLELLVSEIRRIAIEIEE